MRRCRRWPPAFLRCVSFRVIPGIYLLCVAPQATGAQFGAAVCLSARVLGVCLVLYAAYSSLHTFIYTACATPPTAHPPPLALRFSTAYPVQPVRFCTAYYPVKGYTRR